MKNEGISVVLPTYNRARLLSRSVSSVLSQSHKAFELIIIDDGSHDDTREVIQSFRDDRIQYIFNEANNGVAKARNIGIQNAKYDLIAFIDSDDEWVADKLQLQLDQLNRSPEGTGFVYCRYQYHNYEQAVMGIMPADEIPVFEQTEKIFRRLLRENTVATPCLLIRRECLQEAGYYDESLPCLEDYELILRVSKRYAAAFVDQVLVRVYATKDCVSGNIAGDLTVSSMLIATYKKELISRELFSIVVEEYLNKASVWGCMEQAATILEKMLRTK